MLGAFATIAIDNPMMAATGHRICNDCMKACIYQKQDPVDIPQAETSVLKDVLALPWGFEIYALLTRWNPLDIRRPLPRPDSGRKVLIVGLGPAGFTLAHHLMNDGHTVVAIDGLKIEPLGFDPARAGARRRAAVREPRRSRDGRLRRRRRIRHHRALEQELPEAGAPAAGAARAEFAHFGGIRFGGGATLSMDDAWAMGFDHIALCMGAGKPTVLDIPNGLARGVRQASDFLMALQLTGAAKLSSIANLQLRLPVVVIGGGLTAIDTATESLAYYVRQVEKFAAALPHAGGRTRRGGGARRWNAEEAGIADEFLAHAAAIARGARRRPRAEGRQPRAGAAAGRLGRRDHRLSPPADRQPVLHAEPRGSGQGAGGSGALRRGPDAASRSRSTASATPPGCGSRAPMARKRVLPARAILVAAGTQPNTVLAREDGRIQLDGRYFQAVDETGAPVTAGARPRQAGCDARADASRRERPLHQLLRRPASELLRQCREGDGRREARLPGRVARAWPRRPATEVAGAELIARCRRDLRAHGACGASAHAHHRRGGGACAGRRARVPAGSVLSAAELRNAGSAHRTRQASASTVLAMEGLAMTGAWTDPAQGLVSVIVLEMGGSSDLCALLKPGEPVVLMGPTGTPTEIHRRHHRRPGRRRPGQRGAVLHRRGAAGGRVAGDLLRRLQADARSLQGRRDRARRRRHRLVLRRGAGLRADPPAAGSQLRRQHRAGDGGLWRRPARRAGGAAGARRTT